MLCLSRETETQRARERKNRNTHTGSILSDVCKSGIISFLLDFFFSPFPKRKTLTICIQISCVIIIVRSSSFSFRFFSIHCSSSPKTQFLTLCFLPKCWMCLALAQIFFRFFPMHPLFFQMLLLLLHSYIILMRSVDLDRFRFTSHFLSVFNFAGCSLWVHLFVCLVRLFYALTHFLAMEFSW